MSDRELLELAAKAAGYDIVFWSDKAAFKNVDINPNWSPLTDDGDALRLASCLLLDVLIEDSWITVISGHLDETIDVPVNDDRLAATRRAIVRAAAEVGRTMP
ncbi:hypothetical protein HMPREF1487_04382 [Pseudomonas sp. HPB0071]|uniref:hypothetical protein n=1 Tax=unclassified Pseudomonas TaxID=196821 RepID=UPI0002CAFD2A|nr:MULTISPECIES: hypothetical protein [unclassified Pseudomonas]ENA37464.1 hypothetical protein HMPREF1487_04382 [Pseudomonas sp. HPB0071]